MATQIYDILSNINQSSLKSDNKKQARANIGLNLGDERMGSSTNPIYWSGSAGFSPGCTIVPIKSILPTDQPTAATLATNAIYKTAGEVTTDESYPETGHALSTLILGEAPTDYKTLTCFGDSIWHKVYNGSSWSNWKRIICTERTTDMTGRIDTWNESLAGVGLSVSGIERIVVGKESPFYEPTSAQAMPGEIEFRTVGTDGTAGRSVILTPKPGDNNQRIVNNPSDPWASFNQTETYLYLPPKSGVLATTDDVQNAVNEVTNTVMGVYGYPAYSVYLGTTVSLNPGEVTGTSYSNTISRDIYDANNHLVFTLQIVYGYVPPSGGTIAMVGSHVYIVYTGSYTKGYVSHRIERMNSDSELELYSVGYVESDISDQSLKLGTLDSSGDGSGKVFSGTIWGDFNVQLETADGSSKLGAKISVTELAVPKSGANTRKIQNLSIDLYSIFS